MFMLMMIGAEIQDYILRMYMEMGSVMMNAALKQLRNPELAKDAVQTAMVKLCKNAETLMGLEEPTKRAYVYRTVDSACIDCIRQEERQRGGEYPEELTEDIPSKEVSVLDSLADEVSKDDLKLCLMKLPERGRRVLLLRYVHGETQKQVAQRYGVTEQTIRAWERKALEQVREFWRENENGGE